MSELGWEIEFSTDDVQLPAVPDSKPCGSGKLFSVVQMLQQLLAELKIHVNVAQKDMKLASQNTPGHGRFPVLRKYTRPW